MKSSGSVVPPRGSPQKAVHCVGRPGPALGYLSGGRFVLTLWLFVMHTMETADTYAFEGITCALGLTLTLALTLSLTLALTLTLTLTPSPYMLAVSRGSAAGWRWASSW